MFKIDSRIAGDILEMTSEVYRQRLSRIRKKMADFLGKYCGEYGSGRCKCKDRVNYAIQSHRINPQQLDYTTATEIPIKALLDVKDAMEDIDDLAQDFSFCKSYQSPERTKNLIQEFLDSPQLSIIQNSWRRWKSMNTQLIIDYLSALRMNNNREWYHRTRKITKKQMLSLKDYGACECCNSNAYNI